MALLFILIACVLGAFFILVKGRPDKLRRRWPPGPPAYPIIGHLHLLGHLPHQSLCTLSKLYGPLMGLTLGSVPTVVASSPDMAEAILRTHDLAFASRPRCAAAVHMYYDASLGFAPYGPLFQRLRQLLASELFSLKRLRSFRHVREEEVRALLHSLLQTVSENPQEPVELRGRLLEASNNIICRMVMGKKIGELSRWMRREEGELQSLVEELMDLMTALNVGDFIPWLAWLDPQGYVKRMKVAGRKADALMQAVIDERREARPDIATPNDLLDAMLLAASHKAQGNGAPITDDNIKGILLDLFAGGADTSVLTVEWTLAELINNPKVMQKLQEELDRVVGRTRLVEETDIPSLLYLGMVLKESMRLHPVAPLLLPHETNQECQIVDYKIPPKTRAYINTWAIGRDPSIWERPLDFWPERFQAKNLDLQGQNFELLSFGAGRRRCPGLVLGILEVHLMLAALVQGFAWSSMSSSTSQSNSHMCLLSMSEKFGTALSMEKPLCAFATPRLSSHLY